MSDRSQYIIGILVSLMIAAAYLYFTEDRERAAPNPDAIPEPPVANAAPSSVESVLLESPASDLVPAPSHAAPSYIAPSLTREPSIPDVADPQRLDREVSEDVLETPRIQPESEPPTPQNTEPLSGAA